MTDLLLTVRELARRLDRPERHVRLLLEERYPNGDVEFDQRRGRVERTRNGGWRLTEAAERRYGRALRETTP